MNQMKSGKGFRFGDVVLARLYFVDREGSKERPGLVLFEDYNNVVIMGITSNQDMKGVPLTKKEGAIVDSVIKINYIFTVARECVIKKLFSISEKKKKLVCKEINTSIGC